MREIGGRVSAQQLAVIKKQNSVDVSDIFYFFLLGGGEGGVQGAGGGGRFFVENPRRGGGSRWAGAGERGAGGCLQGIWGGGGLGA